MRLTKQWNIRLSEQDERDIEEIADKLRLKSSEIARRSLRIGLSILRDVGLPGSVAQKNDEGAH